MTDRTFHPLRGRKGRPSRPGGSSAGAHPRAKPPPASAPEDQSPTGTSMVDCAVYVDGARLSSPANLGEMFEALRLLEPAMGWIGLYRPTNDELAAIADEFDLHALAVEDAITAHQRPKLERYGDTLFVVLRAARYLDDVEEVEFGEVHLFVGPDFVITVRHSESPDLGGVRHRLEGNPDLLALGPEAILYAILDRVVDGYLPVVAGLENDIDEIEVEVFRGDPEVSRRTYELTREVIEFERATKPLAAVIRALSAGFEKYGIDEELQRYLRDVEDHITAVIEQVDGFRHLLRDILTVNATLVAQAQNEEMKTLTETSNAQNEEVKKISAWAAILFAPTLIGTVYGMNFENMPELGWAFGYPFALVLMALVSVTLYTVFKRRDWI